MSEKLVAAARMEGGYREDAPFDPEENYPELRQPPRTTLIPNPAYRGVREAFHLLGYDAENFASPRWNPLGWLVHPGDSVVLKPNWIKAEHPYRENAATLLMTHSSIVRAVADYVAIALQGQGSIVVCDGPQTDSSFASIRRELQLDALAAFYRESGIDFSILDIRQQEWKSRDGVVMRRRQLSGDPAGYLCVDLGPNSEFAGGYGLGRYYGADYDSDRVNRHHDGSRNEYLVAATPIRADVFINLPKMKTHKKAGITLSLKNLVGINGDKNYLPHHTEGDPTNGGDQFPQAGLSHSLERGGVAALRRVALRVPVVGPWTFWVFRRMATPFFGNTSKVVRSGNWYGNETLWRMILDINKVLFYANADGSMRPGELKNRKRYLSIVDGIIAGEGNGPLEPDPFPAGLVLAGAEPADVDAAGAILMGFDPDSVPSIREAYRLREYPVSEGSWQSVRLLSNDRRWDRQLLESLGYDEVNHFKPHFGWQGRLEKCEPATAQPGLLANSRP